MEDSICEEFEHALITRSEKAFSISEFEVSEICKAIPQLYRLYTKFSRFVGT